LTESCDLDTLTVEEVIKPLGKPFSDIDLVPFLCCEFLGVLPVSC
jgi:hypothetical protein